MKKARSALTTMARSGGKDPTPQRAMKRSRLEGEEIRELDKQIANGAPARGTNPLALEPGSTYAAARQFEELPMSQATKQGLKSAMYITLTAIQRAALPHALAGRDVLGAAKTGSGKTLAFIIPVLERLYRARWTRLDGLGGIIITPTRELALQIFEELRKVGKLHEFSAALLVGGKNVKEEKERVNQMNILVCTPGRLLQHMDETPGFDPSRVQVLVLDEADRILDMGFSVTLDAILANLPKEGRQTLLFSATQTKSVKDVARLSLNSPEYLSVHADAAAPTPVKLQQLYVECELQQKMDVMWSFIKTHLQAKVILFLSTCKQVRFVHEAFRKLRPGVPLRCLHGNMKQMKRMAVFYEFCEAKAMVLLATDIAARGLDFPTLDWVLQGDCPEDTAAYIHRVGRTARYLSDGRALLLLTPSEKPGMLAALQEAKIPIQPIRLNPNKTQPVGPALQALLSKNNELKEFGQAALTSYLRSVFLQPRKDIFDVTKLPVAEYAHSIGLLAAPELRFLKRAGKKLTEVAVGGEAEMRPLSVPDQAHSSRASQPVPSSMQPLPSAKRPRHSEADTSPTAKKSKLSSTAIKSNIWQYDRGQGKDRQPHGTNKVDATGTPNRQQPADLGARAERDPDSRLTASVLDEEEDDGNFMVLKQRHAVEENGGQGEELGEKELDLEERKNKKKRQKINPSRGSGHRRVFDEEGNAMEPLALLVATEFGDREEGTNAAAAADGLHAVHDEAEQRFALVRQQMKVRDVRDKAQQKAQLKQLRTERKARKTMAAAEVVAAVLGGGDSSDGGHGDDAENEHVTAGPSSRSPASAMTFVLQEAEPEQAHFGMAVKRAAAKLRKEQVKEIQALTLKDKEELALRLLAARRT